MDIYGDMNPADLDDTLVGTADPDAIYGGQGNDSLAGEAGADTLYGGEGNDTLDAGPAGEADSLVGGAGDDTYIVHDATAHIVEAADGGTDTVVTDAGYGNLGAYQNIENLSLDDNGGGYFYGYGDDHNNVVQEIGTADYLVLEGQGGDDTLLGVATAYGEYLGGDGNDSIVASGGGQAYVAGEAGNDTLDASASSQATLYGGDGNDVLVGGAGPDTLSGDAGADTMTGGDGVDTFIVQAPDATNSVDEITDFQAVAFGSPGVRDVLDLTQILSSFTNYVAGDNPFTEANPHLQFVTVGSDAILQVRLDGTGAWSDLLKLDGVDVHTLTPDNFSPGFDPTGTITTSIYDYDTSGPDPAYDSYLQGTANADSVYGGDGNDTLDGYFGNDQLFGGAGDDQLQDVFGANTLYGGDGNDAFYGVSESAHGDVYYGGAGADTFYVERPAASGSTDQIADFQAGAGGDVLDINSLIGGLPLPTGDNPFVDSLLVFVTDGADSVLRADFAGNGSFVDVLRLDNFDWHALTADNFAPGYSIDGRGVTISGTAADESFAGGINADTIDGAGGSDILQGGAGHDTLTGGAGADVFRFDGPVAGDDDVVTDFTSGVDVVALSKAGFGIASLADFDIVSASGGPTEAKATLIVDTVNHTLSWDADGTGAGTAVLLAHGAFTTSAADYMVF